MTTPWRRVLFDIETDNLLDACTRVHSLVLRDVETGEMLSCSDDLRHGGRGIVAGIAVLAEAERVYGHNVIRFDLPVLEKLYGFTLPPAVIVRDTFTTASFLFAHIKDQDYELARAKKFPSNLAGSHSLEAWGYRLGERKGDYTAWCKANGITDPWAEWRPEMQRYCEQDTETNLKLLAYLAEEDPSPQAVEIEHELARYLFLQERNGWPFNVEKAVALAAKLSARREELGETLRQQFGTWEVSLGKFTPKVNRPDLGYVKGVTIEKFKTVEFNPGSRDHIADRLQKVYGWQPSTFTPSGKPEVTEDTLEALASIPGTEDIIEFLTVQKRLGLLSESKKKKAWLDVVRPHPTTGVPSIFHRCKQNFAITHRASHVDPNVAQTPKVLVDPKTKAPLLGFDGGWGVECRELFTVPPGWVQVGADASGLELRCLAHYMALWDGGDYGRVVTDGDIHTVNQQAAGLATRDEAKTFCYAYLYGEGDEACGAKFLPASATKEEKIEKGRKIKKQFLRGLPALADLQEAVQSKIASGSRKVDGRWIKNTGPGFLVMPDGRKTHIRHSHAALNSLLQSSGAVICKAWITSFSRILTERFGPQGWDGKWAALGWIHDEVQLAVRPEIAEEVCRILVESIQSITTLFNWRVPLTGEAKVGQNWKETH